MNIIITPTGGRPEAISLLNSYLERQTFQDFYWIVLDDCEPIGEIPSRCDHYIVADWIWDGENTQKKCMDRLLKEVKDTDKLLICEDDDWYSPNYCQVMFEALDKADIVGAPFAIYYNINTQIWRTCYNDKHASLCHTGVTKSGIKRLRKVTGHKWIDMELWKQGGLLFDNHDCIGIKGMPGRAGLGYGHDDIKGEQDDWSKLEELIGSDVNNYRKRFFICASGGSLTQEDVDYIKGKGTVIVINNTFQLAPWADIVYACDVAWWKAYPEALEHKGRKISILYDHPQVEKWPFNNKLNGLGETEIRTGGNSGHQAINLAYLLGAKEIILLGYDMQRTDGKSHWHGDHKRGLSQQSAFKGWIGHMGVVATQAKEKGLRIINCSRQTALECFERMNLEDVC